MQASNTTRRSFVAALAGAPAVLASDKGGLKLPVTGSGDHTYEVHHDWGELPKSISYGNCHGVCVDSQGHIYIHHTVHATSQSDDTMVVFDPKESSSAVGALSSKAARMVSPSAKKAKTSFSTSVTPNAP